MTNTTKAVLVNGELAMEDKMELCLQHNLIPTETVEKNFELLNFLLETESDLNQWKEIYSNLKRKEKVWFALRDLREWKLEQRQVMTEEEFVKMYEVDSLKAIRTLFIENYDLKDVEFVNEALAEGGINLSEIYNKHLAEPTLNILRHIK